MVLSKQQKELLETISKMFPKGKIKLSITKNGEMIFPTKKKEANFIKRVLKGLSPMSDKSFIDGSWYECTTGEYDPTVGEVTIILDVTKYMADKIGIPNRTSAEEMMISYFQSQEATPQDFAFIMLDVDNFKAVNDTYDHLIGDEVLISIARVLRSSVRNTDIVGRYGGDEMFVLLKNISAEDAQIKAEELRIKAGELKVFSSGIQIPSPTISLGLYFISKTEWETLKELFGQKDSYLLLIDAIEKAAAGALKASKKRGKNRVEAVTGVSEEFTYLEPPKELAMKQKAPHGRRMEDAKSV